MLTRGMGPRPGSALIGEGRPRGRPCGPPPETASRVRGDQGPARGGSTVFGLRAHLPRAVGEGGGRMRRIADCAHPHTGEVRAEESRRRKALCVDGGGGLVCARTGPRRGDPVLHPDGGGAGGSPRNVVAEAAGEAAADVIHRGGPEPPLPGGGGGRAPGAHRTGAERLGSAGEPGGPRLRPLLGVTGEEAPGRGPARSSGHRGEHMPRGTGSRRPGTAAGSVRPRCWKARRPQAPRPGDRRAGEGGPPARPVGRSLHRVFRPVGGATVARTIAGSASTWQRRTDRSWPGSGSRSPPGRPAGIPGRVGHRPDSAAKQAAIDVASLGSGRRPAGAARTPGGLSGGCAALSRPQGVFHRPFSTGRVLALPPAAAAP